MRQLAEKDAEIEAFKQAHATALKTQLVLNAEIQRLKADLKWWQVFKDEKLQDLEKTALAQNYDLRDAVARVEAARANLGCLSTRSLISR